MKMGIILALSMALSACKYGGPAPDAVRADFQAGKTITVGIIGNSIGCGAASNNNNLGTRNGPWVTQESEDDPRIGAWGNQLRVWLRSKNANSEVWNLSAGGFGVGNHLQQDTASQMASRSPMPSLVFIPLQVNDARFAVPLADFKANTRKLAAQLMSYGMTPVLVKENDEPVTGYKDYINAVDSIAKEMNIAVIDTYSNFNISTMMSADNVHPNQAGHDEILASYKAWFSQGVK